ncbi:Transposon Tf2-6 polyprotein [Thelohanellus kitauei]|uniref:RNA-directed DNA polymerase n=1 Tax=Thelohanellus kitauei TaxID=669202 RepID=A0A0C2NFX2_THEKT|nr:Transposon Tf2-6 polyprotein [Thelohanellus kitauei]
MDGNFNSKKFVVRERHRFYTENRRKPHQSIQEFAAKVRERASTCDFSTIKDPLDEALKTGFICGVNNEAVLKAIFHRSAEELTFKEIVEIAVEVEEASRNAKDQISDGTEEISKITKPQKDFSLEKKQTAAGECYTCGGKGHFRQNCKYRREKCNFCHLEGHLEKVCKRRGFSFSSRNFKNRGVKNVVSTIEDKIHLPLILGQFKIVFEVDTGSLDNFISYTNWVKLNKPQLKFISTEYKSATGSEIETMGYFRMEIRQCGDKNTSGRHSLNFVVTKHHNLNLLGLRSLKTLQISVDTLLHSKSSQLHSVKNNTLQTKCKELCQEFESLWDPELGCVKDVEIEIKFKENFKPLFCKPRPVAYALKEDVEKQLEEGIKKGVWVPVQFNDCGTPIVPVKKGETGKLRICGDYSVWVNETLEDHRYPIPSPDGLLNQLGGCHYYSKIDLSEAYNQVKISPESQKRLAISTHKGVFLQTRLPFGIKSAPGYFQELMAKLTAGLQGVATYLDDILVSGTDDDSHISNLRALFQRLSDNGLKCNLKKCVFAQAHVDYLGHTLTLDGICKGSGADAVLQMRRPYDLSSLKSFLGSVQFYHKFIQNLATVASPLYELTSKGKEWEWNHIHERSFNSLKKILASDVVLAHYDPALQIGIACDASSVGLGAVLFQRYEDGSERPIANASKTLNQSQRNYAQIHREALAIIYALGKFHQFLYGREFIIVTDHKPLLSLFGMNRPTPTMAANRLARWANILSRYDYKIEYRNTKEHGNADALSRLADKPDYNFDRQEGKEDHDTVCKISSFSRQINIKNPQIIIEATAKDPITSGVIQMLRNGWVEKVPNELLNFKKNANALSIENNCLLYGNRLVIPEVLQKDVLKILHLGHLGVQKMKSLARSAVFWTGIDGDIESLCRKCIRCDLYRNQLPKLENHPWEAEKNPWVRIHIDHAVNFFGTNWLIIVDSYSRYPCVHKTSSLSSESTIRLLEEDFAHFGYPLTIVSDNGTSFSSDEFTSWCDKRGITWISGAPYHPATNGLAERFVQTFKRALQRSTLSPDQALLEFLIQYRRTPQSNGKSPGELLNGRVIRSQIDTFRPIENWKTTREFEIPKSYEFIKMGSPCYVKNERRKDDKSPKWIPATVSKILGHLHALVKYENSSLEVKRHFEQLRPRYPQKDDSDFPLYLPNWNSKNHARCQLSKLPESSDTGQPIPRRSARIRKQTKFYQSSTWPRKSFKRKRGGVMSIINNLLKNTYLPC